MIALFTALLIFNTVFFVILVYLFFSIQGNVDTMRKEYLELMHSLNSINQETHQNNARILTEWGETINILKDAVDVLNQVQVGIIEDDGK